MKRVLLTIAVIVVGVSPSRAQVHDSIQTLFEAGHDAAAAGAVATLREQSTATLEDTYLEVQAFLRLQDVENARLALARLLETPDALWQGIASSTGAVIAGDLERATALAEAAVASAPNHFFAQYQLGLVRAERQDWAAAITAFEHASQIDPAFAYAHYYAGLAHSKVKRLDRTAREFEVFLKLAPDAPERPAVESIMRTIRGR